jgi:hypothetical protein
LIAKPFIKKIEQCLFSPQSSKTETEIETKINKTIPRGIVDKYISTTSNLNFSFDLFYKKHKAYLPELTPPSSNFLT